MSTALSKSAFLILISGQVALHCHAHEQGHGPVITQQKGSGQYLAHIIKAEDADLGAKATSVGIATWKASGPNLKVSFSKPMEANEIKWILIPKDKTEKPIVLKESVNGKISTATLLDKNVQSFGLMELIIKGKETLVTAVRANQLASVHF